MGNCAEPPPDELILAVKQFNNRDWFECHETLEDLWMGETGEARDLYQGILQVSVALHHWKNLNFNGAMSLLQSGVDHLSRVQPVCQQVNVAGLMASANKVRESLARLGKRPDGGFGILSYSPFAACSVMLAQAVLQTPHRYPPDVSAGKIDYIIQNLQKIRRTILAGEGVKKAMSEAAE